MARALKQLLGNNHPLFLMNVARLERATGDAGVDVRLISDVLTRAHEVIRTIGLDPADTTATELYNALNETVRRCNDEELSEIFGDTAYVLIGFPVGPVSLNVHDIIENAHHQLPLEQRSLAHAQRKLRAELIKRYATHERTHENLVRELAREIGLVQEDDDDHADVTALLTATVQQQKEIQNAKPYLLAIGDIFTDAFIKLNENEARVTKDEDGKEWLSVEFGAKMPYDEVQEVRSVGPSPNAAVSFARLGLEAGLMAYLGDDAVGRDSLDYLTSEKVDVSTIIPEKGAKSSYWYVLRYGADRTMFVKNEEYQYTWNEPSLQPDWIYLSQISPSAWNVHEALLDYLTRFPETKLAFQPGTSHFRWGVDKLRTVYERAHIVIMNREEAMDVTGRPYEPVRGLAEGLHELGPKIVVITDGPKGSYASYDGRLVTMPNYPDPAPPYERTGAGDAFASTIVAALAYGESMETALRWAPINSAYVVQKMGAQAGLLSFGELQSYLENAPEDYILSEFDG